MDQLDVALGQSKIHTDLRSLQDRIIDMQRPVTNFDVQRSTQSDHVDITQFELSQDLFFARGRHRLRFGLQSVDFNAQSTPGVTVRSAGFNGNYRFNDWAAITADAWVNRIAPDGLPHRTIGTYDVFVTLWPSDLIRVDLDTNRKTFDNIKSLQTGIAANAFSGSIDFNPSDALRLSLRSAYGAYSDDNRRRSIEFETIWRVSSRPTIQVGLRTSAFRFSRQLNNGYFNPKSYLSGEGMFRLQSALTDKLDVELAGSVGVERAQPGGSKPLVRASLQTSYKITERWSLDGGVSYFSSREANSSGFARTSFTLGLHRKLD